jgi:hypothetical protein
LLYPDNEFNEKQAKEYLWNLTKDTRIPRLPLLSKRDWTTISDRWSIQGTKKGHKHHKTDSEWIEKWNPDRIEEGLKWKSRFQSQNASNFYNEFTPSFLTSYCSFPRYLACLANIPNVYLWKDFLFYHQHSSELELFLDNLVNKRSLSSALLVSANPGTRTIHLSETVKQIDNFFSYLMFLIQHPLEPLKNKISPRVSSMIHHFVPPTQRNIFIQKLDEMERILSRLATYGSKYLPVPLIHAIGEYLNHNGIIVQGRSFA